MKISVLQNSLFLALLAVTISAAAPDSTVLAHRMQISVRLDSLEFEKQECKRQGRPPDHSGILAVRFPVTFFGSVKLDLCVSAITEWFVL